MDITGTLGYGVHKGYTRYILRCEKEKGLSGEGNIYIEVDCVLIDLQLLVLYDSETP